MNRTFGPGVGLGIGLLAALLAANAAVSYRNTRQLDEDARWVAHTHEVPLADGPAAGDRAPAADPAGGAGPVRVLVIEDHPDAAESLRLLLELAGHEVRVARTGPAGVAAARGFQPDVVLCDLGLPGGMSGYEVARALRADPDVAGARLVAVSGYGQPE